MNQLKRCQNLCFNFHRSFSYSKLTLGAGDIGSGSGKGGGSGGSIREAGGKFGEIEAAREELYFRKLESKQLKAIRKSHDNEIKLAEKEIERHMDVIKHHREEMHKIQKALNEVIKEEDNPKPK